MFVATSKASDCSSRTVEARNSCETLLVRSPQYRRGIRSAVNGGSNEIPCIRSRIGSRGDWMVRVAQALFRPSDRSGSNRAALANPTNADRNDDSTERQGRAKIRHVVISSR